MSCALSCYVVSCLRWVNDKCDVHDILITHHVSSLVLELACVPETMSDDGTNRGMGDSCAYYYQADLAGIRIDQVSVNSMLMML